MKRCHKLVFIGEPGAGKTTCIAAVSEIAPVTTDVACTDELALLKESTTVALDYGELDLGDQGRLLLYGLPGQSRFRYMFDVVREGLLGVVILVDAGSPSALDGLRQILVSHVNELKNLPCLLVLNKHPDPPIELRQGCVDMLGDHGIVVPLLVADARRRQDIVQIFDLLFLLLEHGDYAMKDEETLEWA